MKDVVVLLPGITGSVLEIHGRESWALTASTGVRALFSGGDSIRALMLAEDDPTVMDLDDGVKATAVAADATLIPGVWKIDGYTRVVHQLEQTFELVEGENYHPFPYDWRRDNSVAATRLQAKAKVWLEHRRTTVPDAKLVLVAHSMGGLVSRYFLEVLGGWRDTRALITFGTPYRGSLNALDSLVNGFRKAFGLVDLSEVLRSFTSMYQLLPIYPCLDTGDGELRKLCEVTGVPHLDAAKVVAADGFHREIEAAVAANRDDHDYRENGYRIHPIVGSEQPTCQSAKLNANGVEMLNTWNGEELDGDGTVPAASAVPIELSDRGLEIFAATRHASLQNADHVITQLRGMLTEAKQYRFRAGAPVKVSLDLEDLYVAGEPVDVRIRLSDRSAPAEAVVERLDEPAPGVHIDVPASDADWREVGLPPMPAGTWRVAIEGGDDVQRASDLFVVAAAG